MAEPRSRPLPSQVVTEQEDGRKRVRGLLEEAVDSLAITGAQAVGHAVALPDLDGLLGTVGVERLGETPGEELGRMTFWHFEVGKSW